MSFYLISAALVLALAGQAEAQQRCGYNRFGQYVCRNNSWWSGGRYAGVIIGAVALALLLLACCIIPAIRRRRAAKQARKYGETHEPVYAQQNTAPVYPQAQPYGNQTYAAPQTAYPQQQPSYEAPPYAPPQGNSYAPQGNSYAPPSNPPPGDIQSPAQTYKGESRY